MQTVESASHRRRPKKVIAFRCEKPEMLTALSSQAIPEPNGRIMRLQIIIAYLVLGLFLTELQLCSSGSHLKRLSRSLIFPPTSPTRVQFIGGIGIPVENLHFESVTSGYVLKAEYFLPTNSTEITRVYLKPMAITGRDEDSSSTYGALYRWIIYRGIEMVIENIGLPGRSCLLRLICEHAALPMDHESGLLGEVLDIVLTPSSSVDQLGHSSDREYHTAEHYGRRGGDCRAAYAGRCQKSPMELISLLLEVNE